MTGSEFLAADSKTSREVLTEQYERDWLSGKPVGGVQIPAADVKTSRV